MCGDAEGKCKYSRQPGLNETSCLGQGVYAKSVKTSLKRADSGRVCQDVITKQAERLPSAPPNSIDINFSLAIIVSQS